VKNQNISNKSLLLIILCLVMLVLGLSVFTYVSEISQNSRLVKIEEKTDEIYYNDLNVVDTVNKINNKMEVLEHKINYITWKFIETNR
jgi:hypothetical protein